MQKEIAPRNARFKPLAVRSGGKAVLEVDRAPVAPAPALVFVPAAQQLQALPKALAPSTAAPAQELYPDGEYKAAPSTHPKLVRHVNCYRACEFRWGMEPVGGRIAHALGGGCCTCDQCGKHASLEEQCMPFCLSSHP